MIINNFKTLALASMVGFSSFSAFAQADDMPAKGLVKSMITLPKKQMYASNLVYKAVGADLGKFKLDGWKYKSGKATLSTGSYKPSAKLTATGGSVQVPAIGKNEALYLEITEEFSLESDYDFGSVMISADGGNTWQKVHTVTGQSAQRTAQVNISSYAGKTIQIALTLTADGSFAGDGWDVYGLELYRSTEGGDAQPSMLKSSSLKAGAAVTKEIKVVGIHDDNFPEAVYVDFVYKENGVQVNTLDIADLKGSFSYLTDNNDNICTPQLYTPSSNKWSVDVMVVMDNSGSMGGIQTDILNNINTFVTNLAQTNDAQFGLIRFGYGWSKPFVSTDQIMHQTTINGQKVNFTPDVNVFKTEMMSKNTDNTGGYEYGYEALKLAANADFRQNAQKIVIFVTNENTIYMSGTSEIKNENQDVTTRDAAIAELKKNGALVFSYIPDYAEYNNTYAKVSKETGGERYNISSTFDGLRTKIEQLVGGTYTLRYCPKATTLNTTKRVVTVSLVDEPAISGEGTYIPTPDKEYIHMTTATLSQMATAVPKNVNTTFCYQIFDNSLPMPTSVTLFAKPLTSTGVYASYPMTGASIVGSTQDWCGTVPAAFVLDPGVQIYAVAKYADGHEIKSPASQEKYFASTQAVMPNFPPKITLTSTAQAFPCVDYYLKFTVADATKYLTDITVYYREKDAITAFDVLKQYTYPAPVAPALGTQTAAISVLLPISDKGVEYYIVAKDNYGTIGTFGNVTTPKIIVPNTTTATITNIDMELDLSSLKIQCYTLQVGDKVRAFYKNTCGGLSLGGYKVIVAGDDFLMYAYGNTSTGKKNGFATDERMTIYVEKANGTVFRLPNKKFIPGGFADFAGVSVNPTIQYTLRGNNVVIPNNNTTFLTTDGTNFQNVQKYKTVTRDFVFTEAGCGTVTYDGFLFSSNPTDSYSATMTGKTLSVTYTALENASCSIDIFISNQLFTLNLTGSVVECTETVKYGTVLIPKGDVTPSAVEGTDFGARTTPMTRSFTFSSLCGSTISGITTPPNFSYTYSGSTINLTYDALDDSEGTVTVMTSVGTPYAFNVRAIKTDPACADIIVTSPKMPAQGTEISIPLATAMNMSIAVYNLNGIKIYDILPQQYMGAQTHKFWIDGDKLKNKSIYYEVVVTRGSSVCSTMVYFQ